MKNKSKHIKNSLSEPDKQVSKLSNRKFVGEDEENNSNLAYEET